MKFKGKLVVLVSILALLTSPTVAYALSYNVNAYNNSTLGSNSYGVYSNNYIMSDPNITYCHVNSVIIAQESPSFAYYNAAECGWFCEVDFWGNRKDPEYFGVWKKQGVYYETSFGTAPFNSNHSFCVQNVIGSNWWRWYVDGVEKLSIDMNGWKYGLSTANSERENSDETNYAHFWNLKGKDSTGTFYYWSNLAKYSISNDPNYILNKVSNTECYVQ